VLVFKAVIVIISDWSAGVTFKVTSCSLLLFSFLLSFTFCQLYYSSISNGAYIGLPTSKQNSTTTHAIGDTWNQRAKVTERMK